MGSLKATVETLVDTIPKMTTTSLESKTKFRYLPDNVPVADWDEVSKPLQDAIWEAIEKGKWPIYLHGRQGRGKTCAMACVYQMWPGSPVRQWMEKETIFVSSGKFNEVIMQCRRNGSYQKHTTKGTPIERTEAECWWKIEYAPLLCVDDVGTRQASPAQLEVFLKLLDLRNGKPLILSGNHDHVGLRECYDARTASRLYSGTVIELTGKDRRLEKVEVLKV